jgi:hypothetical protein
VDGRSSLFTCAIADAFPAILKIAVNEMGLSARAHDKILRVSRTIADLASNIFSENKRCQEPFPEPSRRNTGRPHAGRPFFVNKHKFRIASEPGVRGSCRDRTVDAKMFGGSLNLPETPSTALLNKLAVAPMRGRP